MTADRAGVVSDLHRLAVEIADETARAEIESFCGFAGGDAKTGRWWNTRKVEPRDRKYVKRALRYIELRGPNLPYILDRDGDNVRFVRRAAA